MILPKGVTMTVHIYLRASTNDQDADRARTYILEQAEVNGLVIDDTAKWYVENYSGRKVSRPELDKLLEAAEKGDVLLVEGMDRLTRLTSSNWKKLSLKIDQKGLWIVACDVSTSFKVLDKAQDEITQRVLESVNKMLIEILAAVADKDYEDRRRRQAEGIENNKHKFKGRQASPETVIKCGKVFKAVQAKIETLEQALKTYGVGRATYYRWKANK